MARRRKRRKFTAQFKAEAVQLMRSTGKSVGQIAKELDLTETALRAPRRRMHARVRCHGRTDPGLGCGYGSRK